MKLYLVVALFCFIQIVYCEKNNYLFLNHGGNNGALIKNKYCLGNLEYHCNKTGGYTSLYLEKGCKTLLKTSRVCLAPDQCKCIKSIPDGIHARIFDKNGKEKNFMSFFFNSRICLGKIEINPFENGTFVLTFFENKQCKDKLNSVEGKYGDSIEVDSNTDLMVERVMANDVTSSDDDGDDDDGDDDGVTSELIANPAVIELTNILSSGFTGEVAPPVDLTSGSTTIFVPLDFSGALSTGLTIEEVGSASTGISDDDNDDDEEEVINEDETINDEDDGKDDDAEPIKDENQPNKEVGQESSSPIKMNITKSIIIVLCITLGIFI